MSIETERLVHEFQNELTPYCCSRAMVVRPESAASVIQPGAATVAVGGPAQYIAQPSPRQGDVMPSEIDDSEGIWA
ncbi:unnamed protein product [Strongylus vulgaris]|uniref:Uncharacterized protein n=1 Tax=Strongylus vulgaris TaxID=40348 RepID=A0A3P7LHS9_STRVU|nr:unnamed protein product [Strongylus vulgaris]